MSIPLRPRRGVSSISSAPCAASTLELGRDVVDLEGDVVHPRPAPFEEPADRRVGVERGEQLDPIVADPQERRLDALLLERLAQLDLGSEQPPVGLDGLVEIGDGDTEMVDTARRSSARCYRWGL